MSTLGQKQTSVHVRVMSALPPKADIAESDWHVRFVPKADICIAAKVTASKGINSSHGPALAETDIRW